jgi:predicted RNase H-like nuclease (RuvC/YqgF family)
MSDIFKAMKAKKKRAVDPNAPPRPNLMTHEVKLRSAQETIDTQAQQLQSLQLRIERLERKLGAQSDYLSQLHQRIARK